MGARIIVVFSALFFTCVNAQCSPTMLARSPWPQDNGWQSLNQGLYLGPTVCNAISRTLVNYHNTTTLAGQIIGIDSNNMVYVFDQPSPSTVRVLSIDTTTGASTVFLTQVTLPALTDVSIQAFLDSSHMFFLPETCSGSCVLTAVSLSTGAITNSLSFSGKFAFMTIIGPGALAYGSDASTSIPVIDTTTFATLYSCNLNGASIQSYQVASNGNSIFVTTASSTVLAFYTNNNNNTGGVLQWTASFLALAGPFQQAMMATSEYLLLENSQGVLYALSATNGSQLWEDGQNFFCSGGMGGGTLLSVSPECMLLCGSASPTVIFQTSVQATASYSMVHEMPANYTQGLTGITDGNTYFIYAYLEKASPSSPSLMAVASLDLSSNNKILWKTILPSVNLVSSLMLNANGDVIVLGFNVHSGTGYVYTLGAASGADACPTY